MSGYYGVGSASKVDYLVEKTKKKQIVHQPGGLYGSLKRNTQNLYNVLTL